MGYWNDSDGLDGLVQERCNSSALAMELRLFCTDASVCLMQVEACYADMYKYDPMELAIKRNNKEAIKLLGKELFLNTKERVQPPESYVTRQDTGRSDSELNLPRPDQCLSHITLPGPGGMGCSRAVLNKSRTSTRGGPHSAVWIKPPVHAL